ncbi:MAG: thioredoxin family protein, partial [Planctomycetota bacterium]|nr:thioredoxin family protein [Planctomycetota bacterium]
MRNPGVHLLALAVFVSVSWAGGSGWQTDFDKAVKKAKKSDRPLLVEFTEGDASKQLNKNVFFKGKFKTWAKKRVVLVEINYSKRVNKKLAAQYAALKEKYKVERFPTVMLIGAEEGTSLGTLNFDASAKLAAWLQNANDMVEAAAGGGKWITDWEKAKKLSKRTKK